MRNLLLAVSLFSSALWGQLVPLGGTIYYPSEPFNRFVGTGLGSSSSLTIDASGEKAAYIIQVPASGTIDKVVFMTGTVTTGDTVKVGLYTVDATNGDPTTTAYGGMTTATQVIADANDNTQFAVDIGDATATVGDTIALVIEFNSFVAGNMQFAVGQVSVGNQAVIPYTDNLAGAPVWTKSSLSPWGMGLEYSGGVYYAIAGAYAIGSDFAATSYNTGAANTEGGNIVVPPLTMRVVGAYWYGDMNTDATIQLLNTDGTTVMASYPLDLQIQQGATTSFRAVYFTSAQTIVAGGTYRVTLLTASGTSSTMYDWTVLSAAFMGAASGGTNVYYTTRDGAGAWTNTTTRRAYIGLIIDAVDPRGSSFFVQ